MAKAPTVALDTTSERKESTRAVELARQAGDPIHANDPTLRLMDRRADLAGLPLRRGAECRLSRRAAADLDDGAEALRNLIDGPDPQLGLRGQDPRFNRWLRPEAVPLLRQVLMPGAASERETLVTYLSRIPGKPATEILAQLAIFDLHPQIRQQAISALVSRPLRDYRATLLKGFEHPWPVVADHAAEALVTLDQKSVVPALLHALGRPDPRTPYQKPGAPTRFVKELVRINHRQNCLLCHPPSFDANDRPRGAVPLPESSDSGLAGFGFFFGLGSGLPNLSGFGGGVGSGLPNVSGFGGGYYGGSGILVRADITYLRQDFSTMLPVGKPGQKPTDERFDFLVRERFATDRDLLDSLARAKAGVSPHHTAVLFALRGLTGADAPPSLAAWKKAVFGRPLDLRLRQRGFRAASLLAVDDQERALVLDGNRILVQQGEDNSAEWISAKESMGWTGMALDRKGGLMVALTNPGDLARIDLATKAVTPVAGPVVGKPLVGPRLLTVDGAGGVYFGTDPRPDGKGGGVWYCTPSGVVRSTTVAQGRIRGLGLSPDGETLYVAQGATVKAHAIESAGTLGKGRVLGQLAMRDGKVGCTGLAVDEYGLVYVLNGPARHVEVFAPDGGRRNIARLTEPPVACTIRGGKLYVLTRTALHVAMLNGWPDAVAVR